MFLFYSIALVIVFLGMIMNLPGSLHINPLLLHFYEPHKVLFLTMVFLLMSAVTRIIVLWKHILWDQVLLLSVGSTRWDSWRISCWNYTRENYCNNFYNIRGVLYLACL